jgi:O-antigen ligase
MAAAVVACVWISWPIVDRVIGSVVLFLLCDYVVTVARHGNTSQMFMNAITILTLCLMFMAAAKLHSLSFLRAIRILFGILIVANFVTVVLFPDGIYNFSDHNIYYLLGHRNVMMRTIFPGVSGSIIISLIDEGRINFRAKILMVCVGISLVMAWSATALFAYVLFCISIFAFRKKELPKWFNVKTCYTASLLVFVFIVVLRLQNVFSFLIVDILHKDLTFTGRTVLWNAATAYILKNPIIGYGLERTDVIAHNLYWDTGFDSTHNFFFDILYQNGIIGALLLIVVFASAAQAVDIKSKGELRKIFTLIIMTYAVMVNFEPFINGDLRLFLSIIVYIYYFSNILVYGESGEKIQKNIFLGGIYRKKHIMWKL